MLSLDSPRWRELQHAYGSAADIPPALARTRIPASLGGAGGAVVYPVERSRAPGRCLFGLVRRRSARHPRPIDRLGEGSLQELTPLVAAEFLEWFRAR
jgi:hypothetical protein